jgi:MFS family permease
MKGFDVSPVFLTIWAGRMISGIGSALSGFALSLWVLHTTGSTTPFAMTFVAGAISAIVASPFAGVLVDRWDRRTTMMICDVLSAVLMTALTGLLATGHLALWLIYLVVGLMTVFDSFRSPAFAATVPLIVAREQLPRANAMGQAGGAAAGIIGPLLAGALVNSISFQGVLMIDALTFVVGALTLALVHIPHSPVAAAEVGANLFRQAATGWRYVQQRSGLVGLMVIFGLNHFIFAIATVLIAPLLLSFSTPAMLGLQYALGACGLLLGGLAIVIFGSPKKRIDGVLLFSCFGGVSLAAHGFRPSFALIAVAGFVLFMMLPIIDSSNMSLWQTKVPTHLQGRCFAMQRLLLSVAMALGFCVAGPLSDYVFVPLLTANGLLSNSIGTVIGVGPGRGIALMFILLGAMMTLGASSAYCVPAIRHIDELEDAMPLLQMATAIGITPPTGGANSTRRPRVTLRDARPESNG